MKKHIIFLIVSMLLFVCQDVQGAVNTDFIRGNAKFNVVVIVLTIIFTGLVFFLFRLDHRLKNLEKNQKSNS